ncbi:MAG: hypothetical protein H6Q11_397 [Acidobacteria bacterium]|nr:hypothetical protein [Acidobacteriota bacterium]
MLKRLGLVLVALMLMLAACGDDDVSLSGEEQALADELVTQLTADTSAENPLAKEADARCAAEGMVGAFGLERSQALFGDQIDINDLSGIGAGMTAEERNTFADVLVGCVNIAEVATAGIAESSGGVITADDASCVAGKIDNDAQKAMIVAELSGQEADPAAFLGAIEDCIDVPALIRDQLITAGMPAETADCIVGALGDDFFTAMLGSTLSGETPGLDDPAFTNAIQSCMGG